MAPPVTVGLGFVHRRVAAAVEAVAATDPTPHDPLRGLYVSDEQALRLTAGAPVADLDGRLDAIAAALGLDLLEHAVLAVCAAPELNPRYGRLFAYLQDDVTRKLASPLLVGRLLQGEGVTPVDVMTCLAADGRLRRLHAVSILGEATLPVAERAVKVADRLAAALLGARIDASLVPARARLVEEPGRGLGREQVLADLRAVLRHPTRLPVLVAGPDAEALVARALRRPLVVLPLREVERPAVLGDARLAAALEGRALVLDGLEDLEPGERGRAVETVAAWSALGEQVVLVAAHPRAVVVLGDRTAVVVEAPMPSRAERRAAWARAAEGADVDEVAAKFRLPTGRIAEAAEVARLAARARGAEVPSAAELDLGARRASSSRLGELAAHVPASQGWDDLVLPDRQRELLRSISSYLRHRDQVLSEWGYERTVARTQGLKVLFAGESGTGKTMAAQVLAHELGLDLFRVDLATVVSKYIGETEKNLDRIFAAADGSNAILFFDEADALFGKRSEISDSHDRYANIEVAYLLQKMEGYSGAVILATNFRRNIDDAFARRLDFVIDFPFPEAEDRHAIWTRLLPDEAPLHDDVDVGFLATQFKLSGGAIRNCSLAAAFAAADEGGAICMRHLVRAVAQEYGKQGRLTLEADFERFHELLRPAGDGRH
jgi:hypothetical protein